MLGHRPPNPRASDSSPAVPRRGWSSAFDRATRPIIGALLLTALLLAACGGRTYRTPEVAGVVVSREGGAGGIARWELANGQEYTIDMTDMAVVVYGSVSPNVGDLLLGGSGPDGPWVARLFSDAIAGGEAGCFRLDGQGTDRGAWIETDAGFRLPKAPGFDPGLEQEREGERYTNAADRKFCVNADGQVTSFGL